MGKYILKEEVEAKPHRQEGVPGYETIAGDGLRRWFSPEVFAQVCEPMPVSPPPTPEPVPVEDITPGWYWITLAGDTPSFVRVGTLLQVFGDDWPISGQHRRLFDSKCKWYHAPSPEQLMAMCQKQKPKLCVDCKQIAPDGGPCPLRGKRTDPRLCGNRCPLFEKKTEEELQPHTATTSETFDDEWGIPPAVEVALKIVNGGGVEPGTGPYRNAWNIVRDYLAQHTSTEDEKEQPRKQVWDGTKWVDEQDWRRPAAMYKVELTAMGCSNEIRDFELHQLREEVRQLWLHAKPPTCNTCANQGDDCLGCDPIYTKWKSRYDTPQNTHSPAGDLICFTESCAMRSKVEASRINAKDCPSNTRRKAIEPQNSRACGECGNWTPKPAVTQRIDDGDPWGRCAVHPKYTTKWRIAAGCEHFIEKEKPIETCGECKGLYNVKDGRGACTINVTMSTDDKFAARCLHAKPKTNERTVKTCGECDNYQPSAEYQGRCRLGIVPGLFAPQAPAIYCDKWNPKAKEPTT